MLAILGRLLVGATAVCAAFIVIAIIWAAERNNPWRSGDVSGDGARIALISTPAGLAYRRFLHTLDAAPGAAFAGVANAASVEAEAGRFQVIWARARRFSIDYIAPRMPGVDCGNAPYLESFLATLRNAEAPDRYQLVEIDSGISESFLEVWNRTVVANPAFPDSESCGPATVDHMEGEEFIQGDIAWIRPASAINVADPFLRAVLANDPLILREVQPAPIHPTASVAWCGAIERENLGLARAIERIAPQRVRLCGWGFDPLSVGVHVYESPRNLTALLALVPLANSQRGESVRRWPTLLTEAAYRARLDIFNWVVRNAPQRFSSEEYGFALYAVASRAAYRDAPIEEGDSVAIARRIIQLGRLNAGARYQPPVPAFGATQHPGLLSAASASGNAPLVRYLIAASADPSGRPDDIETPLTNAARRDREDVVRVLLAADADPNVGAPSPLSIAVGQGVAGGSGGGRNAPIVRLLLEGGADPNEAPDGVPLLARAISMRRMDIVGLLLDAGANPNAPCQCASLDHIAAAIPSAAPERAFSVTDLMFVLGNGPARDGEQYMLLGQARRSDILSLLIRAGGRPSLSQRTLDRALLMAAYAWDSNWIERLLQLGANVRATDGYGRGALDDALLFTGPEINLGRILRPTAHEVGTSARRALIMEREARFHVSSSGDVVAPSGVCRTIEVLRTARARMKWWNWPRLQAMRYWCGHRNEHLRGSTLREDQLYDAVTHNPAVVALNAIRQASITPPANSVVPPRPPT